MQVDGEAQYPEQSQLVEARKAPGLPFSLQGSPGAPGRNPFENLCKRGFPALSGEGLRFGKTEEPGLEPGRLGSVPALPLTGDTAPGEPLLLSAPVSSSEYRGQCLSCRSAVKVTWAIGAGSRPDPWLLVTLSTGLLTELCAQTRRCLGRNGPWPGSPAGLGWAGLRGAGGQGKYLLGPRSEWAGGPLDGPGHGFGGWGCSWFCPAPPGRGLEDWPQALSSLNAWSGRCHWLPGPRTWL